MRGLCKRALALLCAPLIAVCFSACADDGKGGDESEGGESISEVLGNEDSDSGENGDNGDETSGDKPSDDKDDGDKEGNADDGSSNGYNEDGITLPDVEL